MLNQVPEAIQQLSESKKMAVTAHIEAKMKSVKTVAGKYAEILIKSYKGYTVGRLLLDPFSLMLYSTKADEFAAVNDLREQGLSVQEAVQRLVDCKKQGLDITQLTSSSLISSTPINPTLVSSTPIRKAS
jgi:conjugal transfer ATP-binding protein TraC